MEPRARAGKNVGKMNFGFGELRQLLYGSGDAREPLPETMRLLDEIATDFIQSLAFEAARVGHYAGRQKIKYEDFEFALRRNPLFLGKVREMFEMSKEVKDARKMPGIGEGNLAKADVGELARLGGAEEDLLKKRGGDDEEEERDAGGGGGGSDAKKPKKKKIKLGGGGGAAAAAAAAKTRAPILSTATAPAAVSASADGGIAGTDGATDALFADDEDIFGDVARGFSDAGGAADDPADDGLGGDLDGFDDGLDNIFDDGGPDDGLDDGLGLDGNGNDDAARRPGTAMQQGNGGDDDNAEEDAS